MPIAIRPALAEDLGKIVAITNEAIETTHAHFATEPVDEVSFRRGWESGARTYPWLVAADGADVLGYAKASPWKSRGAYRWTAEIGVYVLTGARGRGIGRALYAALLPLLEGAGFRTVLAGVALPNAASERLHEAVGMRRVGVLPRVGYKLGAWRDVAYYALTFGDAADAPVDAPSISGSTPPPHQ